MVTEIWERENVCALSLLLLMNLRISQKDWGYCKPASLLLFIMEWSCIPLAYYSHQVKDLWDSLQYILAASIPIDRLRTSAKLFYSQEKFRNKISDATNFQNYVNSGCHLFWNNLSFKELQVICNMKFFSVLSI